MKITKTELRTIIREEIRRLTEGVSSVDVKNLLADYRTWLVFHKKSGGTLKWPTELINKMKRYGISDIEVNEYDHHYNIYAIGPRISIIYNKNTFDKDKTTKYKGK